MDHLKDNRRELLIEVGRRLSDTLEMDARLRALTSLIIPDMADWCVIAGLDGEHVSWLAAEHRDSKIDARLNELLGNTTPFAREATAGLHAVLRTGEPEVVPMVTPEWLSGATGDPCQLEQLEAMSLMILPLAAHGHMIAAISCGSRDPNRYTPAELPFGEELAQQAALYLDNARLYQTEKRAVVTRDEVLAVVAHDLRNPLNTILMSAQLINEVDAQIGEQTRHQLEIIVRSVHNMDRLIQDLLDVARAESGKTLGLDRSVFDLGELLAEVSETFQPQARELDIALDCETGNALLVNGDRGRIQQVLSNLIGNALKFTSAGSIKIKTNVTGKEAVISVADTGRGIDEANLPHLFDRFWQVRKTGRGGAGLGLAISKGIVEAHGGRIWVDTNVGRGTTFYFSLPF